MSGRGIAACAHAARAWLMDAALPLWADAGFNAQTGFFHEKLDIAGRFVEAPLRVRVQARQTYVFLQAGALGWSQDWRSLAAAGIKTLCGPARAQGGAVGHALNEAGALIDPRRDLYDQAFALFAMAHACSFDRRAAEQRIEEVMDYLETQRGPNGGYLEGEIRPEPRWQNPHMHLFEAGVALAEAGVERGEALAQEMAGLFSRYFYDAINGALGEFYASDWSREPGDFGRFAEPGHHCEWIWLLDRWRRHTGADHSVHTEKLWERVQRDGLLNGVAIDGIWRDGGPREKTARLWPQTERLKAALIRFETGQGGEGDVCAAYEGLALYFTGVREGLWRDRRREDGSFVEEPAPASSFYHIMLALTELFRVAALLT